MKELTIDQLTQLLQDEKCSGIEDVIVNGCEIKFKRISNIGKNGFNIKI